MCDLCRELDYQIERCRKLKNSTTDELTLEAIDALITAYEEDKAKLHPNRSDEARRFRLPARCCEMSLP
jgi:hypothetical protein